MKNVVSLWIILLLGLIAYSQDHKWYFNYNTGKSEIGHDIVCGDDGFVYVAGVEYNDLDHDIVVIALDKAGTRQWVYVYEGQQDKAMEVSEIHYGTDGNLYICGFSENVEGNDKYLVFSLTSEGSFRWEYIYDNTGDYASKAYSVEYGGNGLVYAAGEANYDFLVTAINSTTGVQEWIYWFDGACPYSLCDDMASAITVGSDGNVYAAGYSLNSNEKQLVIISLTALGGFNW